MTASYARAKARQWAEEISGVLDIPFHDTINKSVKESADVWFTLQFAAEFIDGTFCKKGYLEQGLVDVVIIAKAGIGDEEAVRAVELIVPMMMDKVDPTQRFTFQSYEPILEGTGGSADASYRVSVAIAYTHNL